MEQIAGTPGCPDFASTRAEVSGDGLAWSLEVRVLWGRLRGTGG